MIKWLSLIAIAAALVCGVADARDIGRGNRIGGTTGFSPDGAFIEGAGATFSPVTGSATSLLNSYGLWTLGAHRADIAGHWCTSPTNPVPNGCSDFYELFLNGHRVQIAERAQIDFGGRFLFSQEDQNFWVWTSWGIEANGGCYWDAFGCNGPVSPGLPDVPAPPTWPPVSTTPPADGTFITTADLSSTIVNQYGVWSWGNAQTGGYEVRLNGTTLEWNPPHLVAIKLQVDSNGQMFIQKPDSSWVVYLDYYKVAANPPTGQVIPLHVDMVPTGPLAGHTAVSPACGDLIFRLPSIGSVGRLAGYLTVTMSDGSAFAGTVAISANSGITLFNASVGGDGVITFTSKQDPMYGLDNFAGISYSVTQNGTTVTGFNFWFDRSTCP